jgi:hypothetical protein
MRPSACAPLPTQKRNDPSHANRGITTNHARLPRTGSNHELQREDGNLCSAHSKSCRRRKASCCFVEDALKEVLYNKMKVAPNQNRVTGNRRLFVNSSAPTFCCSDGVCIKLDSVGMHRYNLDLGTDCSTCMLPLDHSLQRRRSQTHHCCMQLRLLHGLRPWTAGPTGPAPRHPLPSLHQQHAYAPLAIKASS